MTTPPSAKSLTIGPMRCAGRSSSIRPSSRSTNPFRAGWRAWRAERRTGMWWNCPHCCSCRTPTCIPSWTTHASTRCSPIGRRTYPWSNPACASPRRTRARPTAGGWASARISRRPTSCLSTALSKGCPPARRSCWTTAAGRCRRANRRLTSTTSASFHAWRRCACGLQGPCT